MSGLPEFETAAVAAVGELGPDPLRSLAEAIEAGQSRYGLAEGAARRLFEVTDLAGVPPPVAAAHLRGLATGYEHRSAMVRAELVWTGPTAFDVPVRSTARVLTELVDGAQRELIFATYSARPHPPLLAALAAAAGRGVSIWVLVETLSGCRQCVAGRAAGQGLHDPAGDTAVHLGDRPEGARMHAKLAVADERLLLVTSAILTAGGIGSNLEAGVLVNGGTAPRRAAEHLRAMRRDSLLVRI